jgi:hypothetical protein
MTHRDHALILAESAALIEALTSGVDTLAIADARALAEQARRLLQVAGDGEQRLAAVDLAMSRIHRRDGRYWEALTDLHNARIAGRASGVDLAPDYAALASRLGHLALAREIGAALPACDHDWAAVRSATQQAGDIRAMRQATARGKRHHGEMRLLEARLWARALPNPQAAGELPVVETIRRSFNDEPVAPGTRRLRAVVRALDEAYETARPLDARLRNVMDALQQASTLPELTLELLVWAAAARWLRRMQQPELAAFVAAEYTAVSRRATDGELADALSLFGGDLPLRFSTRSGVQKPLAGALPVSTLQRGSALAGLGLRAAYEWLVGRLSPRSVPHDVWASIARLVAGRAGALKGPVMKLAQQLASHEALPPAARAELAVLCDASAPVAGDVVRREVERLLGRPLAEVFPTWDDQPLGAASIGQVHRATLRTGEAVAVKVQYPGIQSAIDGDLRLLSRARPLLKAIVPGVDAASMLGEVQAMLSAECDFYAEARAQRRFGEIYAHDPDVVVPKVWSDLTGRSILVSELIEGQRFREFVEAADEAAKVRAATTIMRVYTEGMYRHGLVHGDPHPGNFLFRADGRVAFLDFGAAQVKSPDEVGIARETLLAVLERSPERFFAAQARAGYEPPESEAQRRRQYRYQLEHYFAHVLWDRPCVMKPALRLATREELAAERAAAIASGVPAGMIPALRVLVWLTALMSELGVAVNWRRLTLAVLYESPDAWPEPYPSDLDATA